MTTNPILTAFVVFILTTVVVVGLTFSSYGYGGNFLENILVEAHGMLLDILVIGIFILWLNRIGEKRLESRRYQEEIDDLRGWESDEAGHRIVGSIRRLNKSGITNIRLERCHLEKADLESVDLTGSDLRDTDLYYADLRRTTLAGTNLTRANLTNADLTDALLMHVDDDLLLIPE
jgi:hypothetical protein